MWREICCCLLLVLTGHCCWGQCCWGQSENASEVTDSFSQNREDWIRVEQTGHWCGAKGLWLVAQALEKDISFETVKAACDKQLADDAAKHEGVFSLTHLQKAAVELGIPATPIECSAKWLKTNQPLGLSVHDFRESGSTPDETGLILHCMVFLGHDEGQYRMLDPFSPTRVFQISDAEFDESWTGMFLITDPRFAASSIDPINWWGGLSIGLACLAGVLFLMVWRANPAVKKATAPALLMLCTVFWIGCGNAPVEDLAREVGATKQTVETSRSAEIAFTKPFVTSDEKFYSKDRRKNCLSRF